MLTDENALRNLYSDGSIRIRLRIMPILSPCKCGHTLAKKEIEL